MKGIDVYGESGIRICQDKEILAQYLKRREEEIRRTRLSIFEQEEVEAMDRRIFRKEITAEVTAKLNAKREADTKECKLLDYCVLDQ